MATTTDMPADLLYAVRFDGASHEARDWFAAAISSACAEVAIHALRDAVRIGLSIADIYALHKRIVAGDGRRSSARAEALASVAATASNDEQTARRSCRT